MGRVSIQTRRTIAFVLGPIMFWLSIAFLAGLGWLIVLWVDVPRVSFAALEGSAEFSKFQDESYFDLPMTEWDRTAQSLGRQIVIGLLLLWPAFIIESLATIWLSWHQPLPKFWKMYRVMICLVPPLRLCPAHPDMNCRLWLPQLGWQRRGEKLRKLVEWQFSVPMIIAALLILPVLVIEWTMTKQIAANDWLRFALHLGTGAIWFAFATEFTAMISITDRKLTYLKKHWIDLVIIVLPLVSFLRTLRFLRVTKIAKLANLERLTKMIRVYRMRGLSMRMFRAATVLEILQRFAKHNPEKQKELITLEIRTKEGEIKELKRRLQEVEREIAKANADNQANQSNT